MQADNSISDTKSVPHAEIDKDFLIALFQETNDHMRNTEQKYLIITAAYIGLISVLVSTSNENQLVSNQYLFKPTRFNILAHSFLFIIGSGVYMMQTWYRTWKEHYLNVCVNIRQYFIKIETQDNSCLFPHWLRKNKPKSKLLVDNFMQHLTLFTNAIVGLLIAIEIWIFHKNYFIGVVATLILVLIYLLYVKYKMRKSSFLVA
jgi:hypothetical protein